MHRLASLPNGTTTIAPVIKPEPCRDRKATSPKLRSGVRAGSSRGKVLSG